MTFAPPDGTVEDMFETPPPVCRQTIVNDATTEGQAELLVDNPHLLNANDEIAALFGGMDAYRGSKTGKDPLQWNRFAHEEACSTAPT